MVEVYERLAEGIRAGVLATAVWAIGQSTRPVAVPSSILREAGVSTLVAMRRLPAHATLCSSSPPSHGTRSGPKAIGPVYRLWPGVQGFGPTQYAGHSSHAFSGRIPTGVSAAGTVKSLSTMLAIRWCRPRSADTHPGRSDSSPASPARAPTSATAPAERRNSVKLHPWASLGLSCLRQRSASKAIPDEPTS